MTTRVTPTSTDPPPMAAPNPAIMELAEALLTAWEAARGGEPAPPAITLRQLAGALDTPVTDAQLMKASKLDPIKQRLKWPAKVEKKPDTPFIWKQTAAENKAAKQREVDEKKQRQERLPDDLARLLVDLVHDAVRRDTLPTRSQLQDHPDIVALASNDKKVIAKAFSRPIFLDAIESTKQKGKGPEPHDSARLFPRGAGSDDTVLAGLIRAQLQDRAIRTDATLDSAKLLKEFKGPLAQPIAQLLDRFRNNERHIPGVHFVHLSKSKQLYFATEALRPSPALPIPEAEHEHPEPAKPREVPDAAPIPRPDPASPDPQPFEPTFRAAFNRLLQSNGGSALIRLADLRAALPQYDRPQFDSGLRRLRQERDFLLDRHDGIYGRLTPEDHAAAIEEYGSTFIYVMKGSR